MRIHQAERCALQYVFDAPIPTTTGEDASEQGINIGFDVLTPLEASISRSLRVEGGPNANIISEFDGPVNFDKEVKINDKTTVNGIVKINNTVEITNTTDSTDKDTGSLITEGGVGIEKNLNVGAGLNVTGPSTFVGVVTTSNDLFVGGGVNVVGVVTIANDIVLGGNLQTIGGGGAIVSSGGTFGNIRVGTTNDNTIDTSSGNLILNSTGGTIDINDDVDISGNLVCGGNGTFTGDLIAFSSSDRNLKDNITIIPNALDKVKSLTGNTFTWKADREVVGGLEATGLIAQEVEALGLPGITTTREDGTMAVRYDALIPVLIEAIKELEARVKTLEG